MKWATIVIAIILLLPASQQSSDVLVLSYNPTYEIWFFMPTGRPKYVSQNVQNAYWFARTKGGVCYSDFWFYCKSGVKIKE